MIKRIFIPGSEWLYYKIYCGPKTADYIISDIISDISNKMISEKVITKWFFIRYTDPDIHIRVRFHFTESINVNIILTLLHYRLEPLVDENIIWKIQLDTYNREIERYGADTYSLSEELFYYDSEMIAKMIGLIEGDEGELYRWLFSLRATDELMNDFGLNLDQKLLFVDKRYESFSREFNVDKAMLKAISDKYRSNSAIMNSFLDRRNDAASEYYPLIELLNIRTEKNAGVSEQIIRIAGFDNVLNNLLNSYLHMMINRMFRTKQRLHELMISALLRKYYMSYKAKLTKGLLTE